MANSARGETVLEIGGVAHTLCLTLGALAEIEALFQRAGYHKQLDVVGYQGLLYALYDPGRWEAVDVLRWLKEFTDAASASPILRAELAKA